MEVIKGLIRDLYGTFKSIIFDLDGIGFGLCISLLWLQTNLGGTTEKVRD